MPMGTVSTEVAVLTRMSKATMSKSSPHLNVVKELDDGHLNEQGVGSASALTALWQYGYEVDE